jgi:GNAT superfamily N-acetyltransferase
MTVPNYLVWHIHLAHPPAKTFVEKEPMMKCIDFTHEEYYVFAHAFATKMCHEQLSFIAVSNNNELAAFILNEDTTSEEQLTDFTKLCPKVTPIFELLGSLDDIYFDRHGHANKGQVLHLVVVGVDDKFAGQGLARKLVDATLNMARSKGFKKIIGEFTGTFSHSIAVKTGFKEVGIEIIYDDFEWKDAPTEELRKPWQNMAKEMEKIGLPCPHSCKLMELTL